MLRKYIEISSNMVIRKEEVLAIEKVMMKKNPDDDKEVPFERTRLTFVNGKQLFVEVPYNEVKKLFL